METIHSLQHLEIKGSGSRSMHADWHLKLDNQPKPIVVFCHGFKGFKDWGTWDLLSQYFAQAGFAMLKFNFSHNGIVAGNWQELSDLDAFAHNNFTYELDDLGKIIDWLVNKNIGIPVSEIDLDRIYLLGHSRGGGDVLLKAAEDSRVRKVATWAAVASHSGNYTPEELAYWREQEIIYVQNSRTGQLLPLHYQIVENLLANRRRFDILERVQHLQIPILVVHGTADVVVPMEAAQAIVAQAPQAQLFEIEKADHVFGARHPWNTPALPPDMQRAADATIDFFKKSK